MNRAILPILRFTTQVAKHEMGGIASAEATFPGPFSICEKLRPQVATLMGNGGFRALLTRALALARAEVPWLHAVHVNAEGILEGMDKLSTQVGPAQLMEGSSVVLAHMLGLLVSFIGAALTLGIVREVWPEIQVNDSEFFIERSYEKEK